MAGLLGPTNPVPGYDQQPVRITPALPNDTTTQNIVDPGRVVRPDNRSERQDNNDSAGSQAARYESNFMTFLQRLRSTQSLPDTVMKILQWRGLSVSSGIDSGFAREMSEFLEFTEMDEQQLLAFLKNQMASGSRFTGALFDALRGAFGNTQSQLLQNEILQFLRRFSDFSSTEHLEGKMLRQVNEMTQALPGQWSQQLTNMLSQLQNSIAAGDRQDALNILRNQIFLLVSRYVSSTHDHGLARNVLSMLTLDVARYENGSETGLLQSLRHLSAAGVLPESISGLGDAELLAMLRNTEFFKAAQNNAFADQLAQLTGRALRGEGGVNAQEAFRNVMNAFLINESVYMPLQHMMLPLSWNGELMFSEMWVDPDAEQRASGGESGKSSRILIKMDIGSLGAFDLLLETGRQGVSLEVAAPAAVSAHSSDVQRALGTILRRNGLTVDSVRVGEMKRPVTVSEIFPKLFERMGGVNVKV